MPWTDAITPLDVGVCKGGCYASDRGEFVGAGADAGATKAMIRSGDGVTWAYEASPFDGGIGNGVARDLFHAIYVAAGISADLADAIITSVDGAAWTGRGNPFGSGGSLVACAVRVTDGALVVAGADFATGALQVAISTDDGVTWVTSSPLPTGTVNAVAVRASDGAILAAGSNFGGPDYVAYSTDGGATWATSSPLGSSGGGPAAQALCCTFRASDGALLVGGLASSQGIIAISTDGGATWATHIPFGAAASIVAGLAVRDSDDAIFAAGRNSAHDKEVAKSTDGGATWTLSAPFGSSAPSALAVAIRQSTGAVYVAGLDSTNTQQFAVSTDSGATWTPSGPFGTSFSPSSAVAVRAGDGLVVAAQGLASQVAVSVDGGTTWATAQPFGAGGISQGCAIRDSDGLLVVVGADFSGTLQVCTSADNGVTWVPTANPEPLSAPSGSGTCVACKANGALVVGGSGAAIVLATSADGVAFAPVSSPFDFGSVAAVDYSPGDDVWMAGGTVGGSVVAISTDDGATWTAKGQPMTALHGVYRDEANGNWWLLGQTTGGRALAVSSDDGTTWTEVPSPLDGGSAHAMVNTGGALALGGVDVSATKQMCLSQDDGATWVLDETPSPFAAGTSLALAYAPPLQRAVTFGAS